MTRLGPLTSQALGRSSYDIVVQGEGEDNPRAPRQQYDDRGWPVNDETKRINSDIIRSHNEVMQVIGVAEPESGMMPADAESNRRLLQQHYEDHMGQTFWFPLRTAGIIGLWGLGPLRQRVLLFRRFDDFLPWRNYRENYGMHAIFSTFLLGLPVAVVENRIARYWYNRRFHWLDRWRHIPFAYVRTHLRAYMWLQRLSIASQFPWLPPLLFFVPFSSKSPISLPPPLPETLTWPSMIQWAGRAFLNLAPIALLFAYNEIYDKVHHRLNFYIFAKLEPPSNPPLRRPAWLYSPFTAERQLAGVPPAEDPCPPSGPRLQTGYEREQEREREREREREAEEERERERRPSIPTPPAENERLFSDPDGSQRNAMESHAAETELEAVASIAAQPSQQEPAVQAEPHSQEPQEARHAHEQQREPELVQEPEQDEQEQEQDNEPASSLHQQQFRSGTPAPGSPTSARRRNTVSSGGGDDGYISEEEEYELSATLISFDVESGEVGDQPSNEWSAELRQSSSAAVYDGDMGGAYSGTRARGTYIRGVYYPDANVGFMSDTMLSRLPATVYSSCTAVLLTTAGLVDLEALAIRTLAWTYRLRHGQPVDDLHKLYWIPCLSVGMSWDAFNHLLAAFLFQSLVDAAMISTALGLGYVYHGSRQGWSFYRVVKEKFWPSQKNKDTAQEQ